MTELFAVFTLAFLSSAHCIGMCGGFAATLGATGLPFRLNLLRQLIYSLGRLFTYAFMGAIGGWSGEYLSRFDTALTNVQQVFSIIAGASMLLIGASVLGLLRFKRSAESPGSGLLASLFSRFLNARSAVGFFIAGLANGFLPCGLVYAFLAMAIAQSSMLQGAALMTVFGLGTVPAMVIVGCGSTLFSHVVRARVYRVAACFMLVAGAATIWRAFPSESGEACHTSDEAAHLTPADPT